MIKKIACCFFCFLNFSWGAQVSLLDHHKENGSLPASSPGAITGSLINNSTVMTPLRPSDLRGIVTRILQITSFHNDEAHLRGAVGSLEKIKSRARAVSSFQPTLVSQSLHFTAEGMLCAGQVEEFQLLQKEILLGNPRCKFEIKFNVTKYSTAPELISKLQEINSKMAPDLMTLVVPKNNEVVYPSVLAKGIEYLRAHGQLIGYQGPTSMIPDGVDFLVIVAENGEIHREEITSLRTKHHLPILVHVSSSFWNHDAMSSKDRALYSKQQAKLLTHLAEEQNAFGYHFVYPFLGATAEQQRDFREPTENPLLVTMRALMVRFN